MICARRTDSPGFFTSCAAATHSAGCPCGDEVAAETTTSEETPT